MITDKLESKLGDIISRLITRVDNVDRTIYDIIEVFTPKLDWKQEAERIWRGKTPFMYTFTIYFHSDGYWEVVKADNPKFQGTIEECKKECEKIFMEMYLNACQ